MLSNPLYRRPVLRDFYQNFVGGPDSKTSFKFEVVRSAIANAVDEPFYVFMNTSVVHAPYDAPEPYKSRVVPSVDRPRLFALQYLLDRRERIRDDSVREDRVLPFVSRGTNHTDIVAQYLADPSYLSEAELELLWDCYRACVEYLDSELRRFLDWFDSQPFSEETILVVTSDHGEHFGEHGSSATATFCTTKC